MINEMVEPFKLPALERIARIVGDYFTGFEITELFRKAGYPEISHDGGTKWRFLYSTFEKLQKRKFGPYLILKFLETVCDPQEYFGRPESHKTIVSMINDVLSFYSFQVNEKGKVIKIKEKRDTITTIKTKANLEPMHDQTISRINITPTQGYAGDNIVLEAWASEPDTTIHLDIIDKNGKRRSSTGQVVFDKPFKHVLTLSKHSFEPGTYSAVFYTTNIKENKTGIFEFLASTSKQVVKPEQETKPASAFFQKNKKTIELGSIFGVASILIAIFGLPIVYDTIFPPEPEINVTDLNAKDGIIEGTYPIYSYEPRTLIPNGTKNEVFFLTVSNTGDGHAHNFWINIDSKPDGSWFDYHTSAVIHFGTPKNCQNKSSFCTIELITKESGPIDLQYDVSFDHKQYQEIVNDTGKLIFRYGFDESEDREIEIFLKMD